MKIFSIIALLSFLLIGEGSLAKDAINPSPYKHNVNDVVQKRYRPVAVAQPAQAAPIPVAIVPDPNIVKVEEDYDINKHESPYIEKGKTLKVLERLKSPRLVGRSATELKPVFVPSKGQIETERFRLKRKNFADFMKREYIRLAERLFLHGNWSDATFFRRKGFKAGGLKDILPEDPKAWNIRDDVALDDLMKARIGLLESLSQNAVYVTPNAAAKSVVFYDCWVSQAKNKWVDDRTDCKMAFNDVHGYLHGIYEETKMKGLAEIISGYSFTDIDESYVPYKNYQEEETYEGNYAEEMKKALIDKLKDDEKKEKDALIAATTAGVISGPAAAGATGGGDFIYARAQSGTELMYMVYFDQKTSDLSAKAKAELDKAVKKIKESGPAVVTLNGHSDRSLDNTEALLVSKKRADAVRDYLALKGVNRNILKTYGFGKNDNIVPNDEGKEAPANRRVEVIFKGNS